MTLWVACGRFCCLQLIVAVLAVCWPKHGTDHTAITCRELMHSESNSRVHWILHWCAHLSSRSFQRTYMFGLDCLQPIDDLLSPQRQKGTYSIHWHASCVTVQCILDLHLIRPPQCTHSVFHPALVRLDNSGIKHCQDMQCINDSNHFQA